MNATSKTPTALELLKTTAFDLAWRYGCASADWLNTRDSRGRSDLWTCADRKAARTLHQVLREFVRNLAAFHGSTLGGEFRQAIRDGLRNGLRCARRSTLPTA